MTTTTNIDIKSVTTGTDGVHLLRVGTKVVGVAYKMTTLWFGMAIIDGQTVSSSNPTLREVKETLALHFGTVRSMTATSDHLHQINDTIARMIDWQGHDPIEVVADVEAAPVVVHVFHCQIDADTINAEGWECGMGRAYHDAKFHRDPLPAVALDLYERVAEVRVPSTHTEDEQCCERAWIDTQNIHGPWQMNETATPVGDARESARSSDLGDLFFVNDRWFVCKDVGFEELTGTHTLDVLNTHFEVEGLAQ